ncbi:MAG: hypothetical protein HUU54_08485 [Ignavibacteriaceae bacterium]|nr:hypothetical protein [Ignavibacteriaceae bacterium]
MKNYAWEFAPRGDYASDYDIMHRYWSKWFEEMGSKQGGYKIVKTDVPVLNRAIIHNFILSRH